MCSFPFTSELQKEKKCNCPLCLFYLSFHSLFNEIRNLLNFYQLVFVLSVDHSCMMVLLLDGKKGEEKKKSILLECTEYDTTQTEQPKLYFVHTIRTAPILQKFSTNYKVTQLNRKNTSLCHSNCDNSRPLCRLLCHMVTNCFKVLELLYHKQRIGKSSPIV